MAAPTLSTSISRRSMLAGAAVAVPAFPMIAALPAAGAPDPDSGPDPDARLFRRIAAAERLRKQHAQACRLLDHLRESLRHHPDLQELPGMSVHALRWDAAWRTGRPDAMLRCGDLLHRYAAAARGAVRTPARTLQGVHAKLRLALIAARWGNARIYLYEDPEWLELALADVDRLSKPAPPPKPTPTAGGGGGGGGGRVAALAGQYRRAVAATARWICEVERRHGACAYDQRPVFRRRHAALAAREDRLAAALAAARPGSVGELAAKLRAAFYCDDLRDAAGDANPALLLPALHDLERLAG